MKLKKKNSSKPLLSDKIAEALTVKPRADIEDDHVFGTKPQTALRQDLNSSDSEDEAVISEFRKRNVNLLSDISKKYQGEVVTRNDAEESDIDFSDSEGEDNLDLKQIGGTDGDKESLISKILTERSKVDSDDFSDSDIESDDYSIIKPSKNDSDGSGDEDDDQGDDEDDDDEEGYDISQLDEPPKEEFEHVKKQNVSEEAKKGGCVRNQLLIWEGMLEMRIHLQRCMATANQMPLPETFSELKKDNDFIEESNATKTNIANVLDKLLSLQSLLFKKFPETKALSSDKQTENAKPESNVDSDEEIPSDTDNEEIPSDTEEEDNVVEDQAKPDKKTTNQTKKRKLDDYETELAKTHKSFKTFRDTTIQKWNDKTRLATAANIKSAPTNTILQQISYILSDRDKLIRRTQLKRSEYDIVGYKKESSELENKDQDVANPVTRGRKDDDEYISEIFDDSDFYHQLLRELIECKSADISDPVQLSRQWIALQQMRSKMKRKVDTKATKGRKIKYVVHNQLVNFMAPEKCTSWTDESTNELYSSLFGKMFEQNNIGVNVNLDNGFKIK